MTKEALNFQKSLREKQGKCDAGSGGLRRKGVSQVGVRLPSLGHHWALVSPGEPRSPSLSASLFLRVPVIAVSQTQVLAFHLIHAAAHGDI